MPRSDGQGLVGQSAKEAWLPDALEAEHYKRIAKINKGVPKAMQIPMGEFNKPWVSIGTAPTEQNIDDAAYDGSA